MDDSQRASLLRYVEDLDERDVALAAALDELATLAEDVHALRLRAAEIVAALDRLPAELEAGSADERVAEAAHVDATAALAAAEAHTARLETAKRPKRDELDQAHRELHRAREEAHDATVRRDRAHARIAALRDEQGAAHAESARLVISARLLAARLQTAPRVTGAGKTEPGTSASELDDWGARARAALFVAHSTYTTEREQVLLEANALGVSVIGEEVGTVSVALVRRRLEQLA